MRTPDDIVRMEVHYCVSALVSTLAGAAYTGESSAEGTDLQSLAEQAFELASHVDDWEEAAYQAGWHGADKLIDAPVLSDGHVDWQALCEENDIEPYQREVFEHWIVSDWLADQLEARGEKVDRDFAGMIVWARTTTGQGIASDSVIVAIADDLNRANG